MQWLIAHLIGFGGAFAVVSILMLTSSALKLRRSGPLPELLAFPPTTSADTPLKTHRVDDFRNYREDLLRLLRQPRDAA